MLPSMHTSWLSSYDFAYIESVGDDAHTGGRVQFPWSLDAE